MKYFLIAKSLTTKLLSLQSNSFFEGPCDGTGRRSGLKIRRFEKKRTGSTPVMATTSILTMFRFYGQITAASL